MMKLNAVAAAAAVVLTVLVSVSLSASVMDRTAARAAAIRGDVNMDGSITSADADAILAWLVGIPTPDGYRVHPNGDVNCDGVVSAMDALVIRTFVAGGDVSAFCIGEPLAVTVATIHPTPARLGLILGTSEVIAAEARDAGGNRIDGVPLVWTSSSPEVASVDGTGRVTAHSTGSTTIRVASDEVQAWISVEVAELNQATVAAGGMGSCALTPIGAAWCWGAVTNSALPVQVGGSLRFRAIAVGGRHVVALTAGGQAYMWPRYSASVSAPFTPVPVPGNHTFRDISAGNEHVVAVTPLGDVFAWGGNGTGQLGVQGAPNWLDEPGRVGGLPGDVVAVSAGGAHTVVLTEYGEAYAWGAGSSGQLGNGDFRESFAPVRAADGDYFVAISAGGRHTLALTWDGRVYAWGSDEHGQLGDNTGQPRRAVAHQVAAGFTAIQAGADHSLGVTRDGALAWGSNSRGQLGDPLSNGSSRPVGVWNSELFVAVSAGPEHSMALTATGAVFAWGANDDGRLGNGTTAGSGQPVAVGVPFVGNVAAVTLSPATLHMPVQGTHPFSAVATDSRGEVLAGYPVQWLSSNPSVATVDAAGLVRAMSLGRATITATVEGRSAAAEVEVGGLDTNTLTGSFNHTCALTVSGVAWCWGTNTEGQLGIGSTSSLSMVPVQVAGGHVFRAIRAGAGYTIALTQDGTAYAWGRNGGGQLGDGSTTMRTAPIPVAGGLRFAGVSPGLGFAVGVNAAGEAWAWGDGAQGKLGNGGTASSTVPVRVSGDHVFRTVSAGGQYTVGLDYAGRAWAWGGGYKGNGATGAALTPVAVSGDHVFSQVSVGFAHTLALTPDGKLWTWGSNEYHQLGDGSTNDRLAPVPISHGLTFRTVSAGGSHSLGLELDGQGRAWGRNASGQLGTNNTSTYTRPQSFGGTRRFETIVAGTSHSLARTASGAVYAWGENFGRLGDGTTTARNTPWPVSVPFNATVAITPGNPTLARGETQQLTATLRDGEGNVVSGPTATWSSNAPAIVSVDNTGRVNALQEGNAVISADIGGTTASVTVRVVASIQLGFGARHFDVGRFSTVEVPVILSYAPAEPVTVFLTSSDTLRARFATDRLVFAPGQTQLNATLSGLNVGTLRIGARDSADAFGRDSATVRVQIAATLTMPALEQWNWRWREMNVGDRYTGEIRLSDPAPEGGLVVSFTGTSGLVPEPASLTIPAGQLQGNFAVRGVAPTGGAVNIRAAATEVATVLYSITVHAAHFSFTGGALPRRFTIGVGQEFLPGDSNPLTVRAPAATDIPGMVTLSTGSEAIATVQPTLPWSTDARDRPILVRGLQAGRTTVTAAAGGWTSNTDTIIVTTPRVMFSHQPSLPTTQSGATALSVMAADSFNLRRRFTAATEFQVWTSDPAIVRVLDPTAVVPAGASNPAVEPRIEPAGAAGAAWVFIGGPGLLTDSARVTINAAPLAFTGGLGGLQRTVVTPGYERDGVHVSFPHPVARAVVVRFTSSDTMVAAVDSMVLTPGMGQWPIPLRIRSRAAGAATLVASAPGFVPATLDVTTGGGVVFGGSPRRIDLVTFQNSSISSWAADTLGMGNIFTLVPRTATGTVLDASIVQLETPALTANPGSQLTFHSAIRAVGVGETRIVISSPGARPDTVRVVVTGPSLAGASGGLPLGTSTGPSVGRPTVGIPSPRPEPVVVTLTPTNAAVALLPTTVTIPAGATAAAFDWAAEAVGSTTVTFTAPGYAAATGTFVTHPPRLTAGGQDAALRTTTPEGRAWVQLRAQNSSNMGHATRPVTIRVTSSNPTVLVPRQEYVRIVVGEWSAQVASIPTGVGSARLIYADSAGAMPGDSSAIITVSAPQLSFCGGPASCSPLPLGMRQMRGDPGVVNQGPVLVSVPDPVRGGPLVITIASSEVAGRVVSVPATVTIPEGATSAVVRITALDTIGSISLTATAPGFTQARQDVNVTRGRVLIGTAGWGTAGARGTLHIDMADASGAQGQTTEDVVLTVVSSNPAVVAVEAATITVAAGLNRAQFTDFLRFVGAGTATITVSDPRTGFVHYTGALLNMTVTPP